MRGRFVTAYCPDCGEPIPPGGQFCPRDGTLARVLDRCDPWSGTLVDGRYRMLECVGEGGMGRVYRALHMTLRRKVAIKVLHPHLSAIPDLRARFVREARALCRLRGPGCVTVLDFGAHGSELFMAMEYLEGHDLAAELTGGPIPVQRALWILVQLLAGIGVAHDEGVLHRDLKPANVFLSRPAQHPDAMEAVKILDFGVAKLLAPTVGDAALTAHDVILGTPRYLAPEQVTGGPVGAVSDLYSAAAILFEMCTGAPPYLAMDPMRCAAEHVFSPIPDARRRNPALSASLAHALRIGLAKQGSARFQSARAFSNALLSTREGRPLRRFRGSVSTTAARALA